MTTNEKIAKVRELMKRDQVQAVVIPSGDPHMSEYFSEHWRTATFISGFTGEAGTLVITADICGLWTDGRFYVQAQNQLAGSEAVLFRASEPDCPSYTQYLHDALPENSVVALNGKLFTVDAVNKMKDLFADKEISIDITKDYGNDIWEDRPAEEYTPVYYFDEKYSGKSAAQKIAEVRETLAESDCDALVVSRLDNTNWLFNVRAHDVLTSPLATSYGFISKDSAVLFLNLSCLSDEAKEILAKNGICVKEYEEIYSYLENLDHPATVLCDGSEVNDMLYNAMEKNHHLMLVPGVDPIPMMKAVKNETEIANTYTAYLKDGCAEAEFFGWLFEALENGETVTEWDCSEKIAQFRAAQGNYVSESFTAIMAYRDNAAMMHYAPTADNCKTLAREHLFLNDSGGQYFEGTTDTTRTFALGPITDQERRDFTTSLKGVIALSNQKFLAGSTGSDLDAICRGKVWQDGLNYRCGTGHGVGYFLNVHEAPPNFRDRTVALEEGMFITIEPGVYTEGSHGVRTENSVVVAKDVKTEYGQFYRFDTFTLVPIDTDCIDISLMTDEEICWLNSYHQHVYDKVAPLVSERARKWLEKKTQPIKR